MEVHYVKNRHTYFTDPVLIITLYFVQYINFLLHYLIQKVLVCPSIIAPSLLKILPRTSRGSGLQGPHSLLSEPAPFQVELLYNQCPQIIFFDRIIYHGHPWKILGVSLDDYINRLLFAFQKPLLTSLKMLQASTNGYLFDYLFFPADKQLTIFDLYLYLSAGSLKYFLSYTITCTKLMQAVLAASQNNFVRFARFS